MALNLYDNREFVEDDSENLLTSAIEQEVLNQEPAGSIALENNETTIKSKNKLKSFFLDLVFYVIMIIVCVYIIPNYIMQRTIVDGSSMANTLYHGEHLMVEKISYRFDQLDRFDIVVFYPYGRDKEEYYVKRVIGLPGETIQIIGKDILINGAVLEENYGREPITYAGIAYDPIYLEEDEYFVMGDNRGISKDSRYSDVGKVQKENIGGRAFLRIWPLNRFGSIK